eukprot:jgi/Bigna1/133588/aug1.22_g8296
MQKLETLKKMGFSEERCLTALKASEGHLEGAAETLLSCIDDESSKHSENPKMSEEGKTEIGDDSGKEHHHEFFIDEIGQVHNHETAFHASLVHQGAPGENVLHYIERIEKAVVEFGKALEIHHLWPTLQLIIDFLGGGEDHSQITTERKTTKVKKMMVKSRKKKVKKGEQLLLKGGKRKRNHDHIQHQHPVDKRKSLGYYLRREGNKGGGSHGGGDIVVIGERIVGKKNNCRQCLVLLINNNNNGDNNAAVVEEGKQENSRSIIKYRAQGNNRNRDF